MRLSSFIVRGAVNPSLQAKTRDDAIVEMVESLHAAGAIESEQLPDIVAAVLRREQLGTTGIGRGIAIPHSRHAAVNKLVGALAISQLGLGFESLDDAPVHILVLLISPQDQPGIHLRALEAIVQWTKEDEIIAQLKNCETADQLWELLP